MTLLLLKLIFGTLLPDSSKTVTLVVQNICDNYCGTNCTGNGYEWIGILRAECLSNETYTCDVPSDPFNTTVSNTTEIGTSVANQVFTNLRIDIETTSITLDEICYEETIRCSDKVLDLHPVLITTFFPTGLTPNITSVIVTSQSGQQYRLPENQPTPTNTFYSIHQDLTTKQYNLTINFTALSGGLLECPSTISLCSAIESINPLTGQPITACEEYLTSALLSSNFYDKTSGEQYNTDGVATSFDETLDKLSSANTIQTSHGLIAFGNNGNDITACDSTASGDDYIYCTPASIVVAVGSIVTYRQVTTMTTVVAPYGLKTKFFLPYPFIDLYNNSIPKTITQTMGTPSSNLNNFSK